MWGGGGRDGGRHETSINKLFNHAKFDMISRYQEIWHEYNVPLPQTDQLRTLNLSFNFAN